MLFSFLSRASRSSRRRSTSSLLSYLSSISDSEERGNAERNAVCYSCRWVPQSFRTEEEEGRFAQDGELLVRVFRRARTPSGAMSRMDVDSLEKLSLRSAAGILRGKLGSVPLSSGAASALSGPSCPAFGLKQPLMTWNPRVVR